jgi:transposase-like protein
MLVMRKVIRRLGFIRILVTAFRRKRFPVKLVMLGWRSVRDRAGTFTPTLVPKGSRRIGGLDEMIISLYAGGMTIRDISHHLASTIGTELSHERISKITDAVLDEVHQWQQRPLEEIYPITYLDAIVVKIRRWPSSQK